MPLPEQERIIDMPFTSPGELIVIKPEIPLGLIICGQGQAGKSTLKEIVADHWREFDPEGVSLAFTNSNGFRGLTYKVLEHNGIAPDAPVDKDKYRLLLADFLVARGDELEVILDSLYDDPLHKTLLRSPAVESVVATTSEHETARPLVNTAGAKALSKTLIDPAARGMDEAPGLIILDMRSAIEGREKFLMAGVKHIGTIVMTCPEFIAAEHALGKDAPKAELKAKASSLKLRNHDDRTRRIGKMTLPKDLKRAFYVDQLLNTKDHEKALAEAGVAVAQDPEAGIVVATDKVTEAQEKEAFDLILEGMLSVAYD